MIAMVRRGPAALLSGLALAAGVALASVSPAAAQAQKPAPVVQSPEKTSMRIKNVKSPGGIEAWLVEEHGVPLIAMRFAFEGGNAQDPAGKDGLANFLTAMMDEGAGDIRSAEFQERMEEIAMRMSFEDGRDYIYGSFETLTMNRKEAVELLRLAVTKPRFDADAVERMKKQLLASIAFAEKDPDKVAGKEWNAKAFPGHPYGRNPSGSVATVTSITGADLESYRKRVFARDTLKVAVVGDIDAEALGQLLDQVFGALPAKGERTPVPEVSPTKGITTVVEMDVPQSVAVFGLQAMKRKDPAFVPAFVLNHIIGGGGFASRLMEEVREKRGLAYSVYTYLQPYKHAALFAGGVATKNEEIGQSLDVIRAELTRMATQGPSPTELDNAKKYLTGSYALRFDTSSKIASQLLGILQEDLGIDYVDRRNAEIDRVTVDDVKRIAADMLKVENLNITVVGKPKNLPGRS